MTKKITLFFLLGFLVFFVWLFWKKSQTNVTHCEGSNFFELVPIVDYSLGGIPIVDFEIEENIIKAKLDTGDNGFVSIKGDEFDKIQSKNFIKTISHAGIRGNIYKKDVFQISQLQIGRIVFHNVYADEANSLFTEECFFPSDLNSRLKNESTRLGWKLFVHSNLLIDLKNEVIGFVDSFETLQKEGYFIDSFLEVPLFSDKGLLEIEALSDLGNMRYILDTGCTFNLIHTSDDSMRELGEIMHDPSSIVQSPFFKIGEKDLGIIEFRKVPIKMPIHVEAILGMEFFKKHTVFFDFSAGKVYISLGDEHLKTPPYKAST